MRFKETVQPSAIPLLLAVIDEMTRGIEMISAVDDLVYKRVANGTGSIGGHFRHNLDFVTSFLNGIAEQQIDYNRRERNLLIETDRKFAIEKFEFAIARLQQLSGNILERFVYVRSEVDPTYWLPSSLLRELEFLHSHTVHHHALIREKLASFGVAAEMEFGVAPSTLEFWKQTTA